MNLPTQWIDKTEKAFINRLQNIVMDKTLIVSNSVKLHLFLQLVDRVIIMENGKIIVDGPKDEVFTTRVRLKWKFIKNESINH